jgi:disulfide bond formation protein DsbB
VKLTFEYWAEYFLSWLVPTLAIASSSGSALPCATVPWLSVFFLFFFFFFFCCCESERSSEKNSVSVLQFYR